MFDGSRGGGRLAIPYLDGEVPGDFVNVLQHHLEVDFARNDVSVQLQHHGHQERGDQSLQDQRHVWSRFKRRFRLDEPAQTFIRHLLLRSPTHSLQKKPNEDADKMNLIKAVVREKIL